MSDSELNSFVIYNASAGSGKTYTVVRRYLSLLLSQPNPDYYRSILALTFTNKAVAEMKSRVIETLTAISQLDPSIVSYLSDISNELNIDIDVLQTRADRTLKHLLHHYSGFDIITIDTFTHRLIRTFSQDLGISLQSQVEMNTNALLEDTIERLLEKLGKDKWLTNRLVSFAKQKLQQQVSWHIDHDLFKIGELLFSEQDHNAILSLKSQKQQDFTQLIHHVNTTHSSYLELAQLVAQNTLDQITATGLSVVDFSRGTIPKYFNKIINAECNIKTFQVKWIDQLDQDKTFYTQKASVVVKDKINELREIIVKAIVHTRKLLLHVLFLEKVSKYSTPLSILSSIQKEFEYYTQQKQLLPIAQFNTLIGKAIQDMPVGFIYERIGERYQHFFIDEFQDTSQMQWNNLFPLIHNVLSSESKSSRLKTSLTLVGDAKQAIYRWRGGDSTLLMSLSSDENPFISSQRTLNHLAVNYRSTSTIVSFTNDFFTFLASVFTEEKYKELFILGNKQKAFDQSLGKVTLNFIEKSDKETQQQNYASVTYRSILDLQTKGYSLGQICILTRKRDQGVYIANYLLEKGIGVTSSETLLLKNSQEVCFIVGLLSWVYNPLDISSKLSFLSYCCDVYRIENVHGVLEKLTKDNSFNGISVFFQDSLGICFELITLLQKPLYDAVVSIINSFNLWSRAVAPLQFFLDEVHSFSQSKLASVTGFLAYWETSKDQISCMAPKSNNAVEILTIHKSKGLEYDCVIYPFVDTAIEQEQNLHIWLSVNAQEFQGFDSLLLPYSKDIALLSDAYQKDVSKYRSLLELDAFNLLYVAFTRAKKELIIHSSDHSTSKSETYATLLIQYLKYTKLWNSDQMTYAFGQDQQVVVDTLDKNQQALSYVPNFEDFQTKPPELHTLMQSERQLAIDTGILLHELLSKIQYVEDLPSLLSKWQLINPLHQDHFEILESKIKNIIYHKKLSEYYTQDYQIYNERSIFCKGAEFTPDRVCIHKKDKSVVIIDYKTTTKQIQNSFSRYKRQLEHYKFIYQSMGYEVSSCILVFIKDTIELRVW